jgi:putative MFS transporter
MESNNGTETIGELINQTGTGRFQRKMLVICGLAWAFNAMEIMIIAFILPALKFGWQLEPHQEGLISGSIFIGMLLGAWFWGMASDYIGRKKAFIATVIIYSLFTFVGFFIPEDYITLALARCAAGFGVGGMLPVVSALLSEFVPTKKRGRYMVLLESFWIIGTLIAAFLAWYLIPTFPKMGWRYLFAIGGLPVIMAIFIYKFVPESPRFLMLAKRKDEAKEIINKIADENHVVLHYDSIKEVEKTPKVTLSKLWHRKFVRITIMLWITWFFLTLANYGVLIWLPTYFYRTLFFSIDRIYTFVVISALGQIPGYLLAVFLIERLGRKKVTGIFILLSALFAYLFAISVDPTYLVLSAALLNFSLAATWSGMYAYTPELYPTETRATGIGWASGIGRIGAFIGPMMGALLIPISIYLTLTVFAVCFAVAGISVLVLGLETKGKDLTEVVDEKSAS